MTKKHDEFKGDEFYEEKSKELRKVIRGMKTKDTWILLVSFTTDVISGTFKDGDLEYARELLDLVKVNTLNQLADNGWE